MLGEETNHFIVEYVKFLVAGTTTTLQVTSKLDRKYIEVGCEVRVWIGSRERFSCRPCWALGLERKYILLEMPRNRSTNFPISKEMARILRHGTKPREAPIPMNGDDGSVLIRDLMAHPSIAQHGATETTVLAVAREVEEADKLRFALYRESVTEEWRVRALNGRSLRIGQSALPPPGETPGRYLRGTTPEAAHTILKTGIRVMKRTHIRMIEYSHTPRGAAYLKNRDKKQIWLTIDGPNAATAGVKFIKLEDDVVLPEGVRG